MGKNLDRLHWLFGSCQFFESPLNIHKMSQVICRHFWVLVGLGRTFLDHCQLVLLRLVILPVIWRVRGCLLHSELIVSMLPESHMCRVLFKGSQPVSAFSTYPFLYILAIPSVELVRDHSSISLVIILTLGSRSKTPAGF